ncbi:MAG: class II fructose-bisphosphate aldolase, partial [Chloroflexi bacterium]|nr:class II fructose-bisphosphate aldolase [Chloroflexota bacterium]
MLTIGYAFNEEDAELLMREAAPDIFIFHAGITRGGSTGYTESQSLADMAARSQAHYDLAKKIKPDVILLAHGAALVNPADAQSILDQTDCHGVQLGSSIERMAIEQPLVERAAAFKAIHFPANVRRSPVILGFSGIYLPQPERIVKDPLRVYAALGLDVCRQLSVPACLLFNESPYFDRALEAIELGYNLVMFTDDNLNFDEQVRQVRQVVLKAHQAAVSVEGEVAALAGVAGELSTLPDDLRLTGPEQARFFVEQTGVDALAVNVGQAHLHGRQAVRLSLERLVALKKAVSVPLVLHGATSVHRAD